MPSQKNVHQLAEIVKNLSDSNSVILTEYAGLTVKEQTMLRAEADKVNGAFMVTKNNLIRRAIEGSDKNLVKDLLPFLQGPTAVLFTKDSVAGSKVAAEFAKDHEKLVLKAGIVDGKVVSLNDIIVLSKLPSREQLLSSLLAQLQAPAQALVRQLNAPIQNFVYGLEALKAKLTA